MNIRSYGPGKFDTYVDKFAYEVSLDGADAECGDVDCGDHCALLNGPLQADGAADLNEAERAFLAEKCGCIVITDSDGFVSVVWYTDEAALRIDWADAEAYESGRA